ncbi:MAG: hypothetical protein WEB58_23285 [Planctomycetaceae bacterium]
MSDVVASRSVLIEVLTILGKDLDKLVIVGGWVPDLAFPFKGHIGSIDVDLALDATKLKPMAYESIGRKLVDAGYCQSADKTNQFIRTIRGTNLQVKVDLITGEFPQFASEDDHIVIQELAIWKARGVDLAFMFQQEVAVEGTLPDGGHNKVFAKIPTIPAFLCIKAITLSERKKEKDAYDIYFCVDNYSGGYKALANEFQGKLDNPIIAEGIAILREKFSTIDSIGPLWAAQAAEEATAGTSFDIEMEQRRAFELVNALLRELDNSG